MFVPIMSWGQKWHPFGGMALIRKQIQMLPGFFVSTGSMLIYIFDGGYLTGRCDLVLSLCVWHHMRNEARRSSVQNSVRAAREEALHANTWQTTGVKHQTGSVFIIMGMDRRRRASLALTLNFLALILAISALTTSYWCEGNRKVVKPFCTGPVTVKQTHCIRYNSSNINDSRLVQYIWETGEDKFVLRKFHTGIWFSCEQNVDLVGKDASFLPFTPANGKEGFVNVHIKL